MLRTSGAYPERLAAAADRRALDWCTAAGLVPDERTAERFRRTRSGALAAYANPRAAAVTVDSLATWHAFACLLDDHLDTRADADHGQLLSGLAAVTAGDRRPVADPDSAPRHVLAFDDLWSRTTRSMSDPVHERFSRHWGEYWRTLGSESLQRRDRARLSVEEYIRVRRITTASREAVDITDHFEQRSLPDELFGHPWHRELLECAEDIVGWANDLVSWRQEADGGEVHNLVLVIARTTGRPHERAAEEVRGLIEERVRHFERLADRPPHPGLTQRAVSLRNWVRGYRRWAGESGRYRRAADCGRPTAAASE
ncbi:terpene synthase family protein [Streptomyces sp. NPDC006798]|uniref:terpene synthase family protein n=1 Tax=Streptomyces sp. NPDC006798 TaxID=3155462 RepID=UPI003404881B